MKICIAGLSASGKTTLANELAKDMGIANINESYKRTFRTDKALIDFLGKKATPKYTKAFDQRIIRLAKGKDCVISTWYAPWIIKDATLRVWLEVSEKERIRRKAKEKKKGLAYAKKYLQAKDRFTKEQFRKAYGKEMSLDVFDVVINYEKVSMKEAVAIISMLSIMREKEHYF